MRKSILLKWVFKTEKMEKTKVVKDDTLKRKDETRLPVSPASVRP